MRRNASSNIIHGQQVLQNDFTWTSSTELIYIYIEEKEQEDEQEWINGFEKYFQPVIMLLALLKAFSLRLAGQHP